MNQVIFLITIGAMSVAKGFHTAWTVTLSLVHNVSLNFIFLTTIVQTALKSCPAVTPVLVQITARAA